MHILSIKDVVPIDTPHGEIIYELIGRTVVEPSSWHSLAYVTIPPGKSSPLHLHPEAEESYFILHGEAHMILDDEDAILQSGQAVLIPPKVPHKIVNAGETDLSFLAFCVPAWEPSNTVNLEDAADENGK